MSTNKCLSTKKRIAAGLALAMSSFFTTSSADAQTTNPPKNDRTAARAERRFVVNEIGYRNSLPSLGDCVARSTPHCEDKASSGVSPDSLQTPDLTTPDLAPDLAGDIASSDFGAPSGGYSASPAMIGDFFGGGSAIATLANRQTTTLVATGYIIAPGSFAFEVGSGMSPPGNDFFSTGPVINGNSVAITEPVPPSGAPTSPGPGFVFDGGTAVTQAPIDDGADWNVSYSFSEPFEILLPIGAAASGGGGGAVVGRPKIFENGSSIPRDRLFFNYSYFDNVPLIAGGVNVNRFTPGFEKTFFDQMASFEFRAPFAATLSTNVTVGGMNDHSKIEMGDLFMAGKVLLLTRENFMVSAGMSLTVPTADDVNVFYSDGSTLVHVDNQTVHVAPFLGILYTSGNFFAQGFMQIDVDVNGNPVQISDGFSLVDSGRLQDATFFDGDFGVGFWIPVNGEVVDAIAPTVEMHYHETLNDTDVTRQGGIQVGRAGRIQLLNAVVGGTIAAGPAQVSMGYAIPVGNGADQLFDGEFRAFINRYY